MTRLLVELVLLVVLLDVVLVALLEVLGQHDVAVLSDGVHTRLRGNSRPVRWWQTGPTGCSDEGMGGENQQLLFGTLTTARRRHFFVFFFLRQFHSCRFPVIFLYLNYVDGHAENENKTIK